MSDTRVKSLDGVRGVAVLAVLLYHHSQLNSGYAGVDLFFVLSGYLITGILRRAHAAPDYWWSFWVKRITRILPPQLLLLAASVLFLKVNRGYAALCLLTMGDWVAYRHPEALAVRPLWSLAVEEHFYLLWPFAVRYLSWRALIGVLTTFILAEPLLRAIVTPHTHSWQTIYFLTPFRLDGLCYGSLLALLLERSEPTAWLRRWSGWGALLGCAAWLGLRLTLGFSFSRDANGIAYNSLNYALIAMVAGCLLAHIVVRPRGRLATLLSWRPICFVGLISYGLYLYQVPIRSVVLSHLGTTERMTLCLDALPIGLLAWISYRYYERPLVTWGRRLVKEPRPGRSSSFIASASHSLPDDR
jgi:peptidoglycan/LPS O-acetylase OafA/YrhL